MAPPRPREHWHLQGWEHRDCPGTGKPNLSMMSFMSEKDWERERETEHFDLSDSQRWLWAQWADPHLVCQTDVWNKPCRCRVVLQNTFLPGWNGAADCVLCTALTWQARLESDMAVVCMGEKLASNSHWKVAHPRKTPNTFNQHNQFASNLIMPRVFLRRSWTLSLALL